MENAQVIEILLGIAILYLSLAIRWVPKPYNWVIEINFPFPGVPTTSYVWKPGLHILWFPVKPIMFVRSKINMAQKPLTLHMGMSSGAGRPDPVDFQDTKAGVLAQIIYQVVDPVKATYHVQEIDLVIESIDETGQTVSVVLKGYERATINKVEADLRSFFGHYEFDEANEDSTKTEIEEGILTRDVDIILTDWGVKVLVVDIIDFILDPDTAAIRQRRLLAKTTAEVQKTEAEGEKTATITIAEGKKQAALLAGQGELERLNAIKEVGLTPEHAAAYVLAQGSTEALGKTTTTVIATSEGGNLSQLASMAGMLKGVLGGRNESPSPTPSAPATPPQSPASTQAPATSVAQASQEQESEKPSKPSFDQRRRQGNN